MDNKSNSLAAALSRLAEAERQERGAPLPAPEELVAYHEGKLDEAARDDLRSRLALDPEAAREFLDLKHFADLEPPKDEDRLVERDVENARARILARIQPRVRDHSGESEAVGVHRIPREHAPRPQRGEQMFRIAALISAMAASVWIFSLYQALEKESGPGYAAVIDISTTRGARPHPVPPQTEQILLVVHGPGLEIQAQGQLEVATDSGEVLRTFDLEPPPGSNTLLHLTLPRSLLPDGTYRIAVFRLDAGGRRLVKEYRWTLAVSETL